MAQIEKIKKEDLLKQIEGSIHPGSMFFDKRGENIIRISEIKPSTYSPESFSYEYEDLISFKKDLWKYRGCSSLSSLTEYYDLHHPIKDLKVLYEEALGVRENGLQDLEGDDEDPEMSTELVHLHSKENLLAMKEGVELIVNKKNQLEKMINFQLEEMKQEFTALRNQLSSQVSILLRKVEKIMRVVNVLELYLGIEEDLFQLQKGEDADKDEPLTLRQQILYMDEEVGIIENQGIDFICIELFDEWLLKDKHYEILLPEKRSIVVFRPRRRPKRIDQYTWDRDPRNNTPYFLIRNGENLYRISSDNMFLPSRLFPKRKEFQEMIEKMDKDSVMGKFDKEKIEDMAYLYQRIVFFIQGLIDRTDVFGVDFKKINFMKMEECDAHLRLIYDDELCLPTGRLCFCDWRNEINSQIQVGSRILWLGDLIEGESAKSQAWRYLKYYENEFSIPDKPSSGVYTVEECEDGGKKKMCFKYVPEGDYWNGEEYVQKKNRVTFLINLDWDKAKILHYDHISLDDVEFYLNSRIDRFNYLEYLPILKTIKKLLLEEQNEEDQFCLMLIGRCQSKGLVPKKGLYYEDIILELINWWKYKNKWKRPISKNDELAMRMIERRLFAVSNKKKWFK